MANGQIMGMRGVYLVAAELSKRGFIVSPTSRGAQGADLLVTDQMWLRAFTVQVKTDRRGTFWLVGKKAKEVVSRSHVYVSVRIRNLKKDGEVVEYYVVRSTMLSKLAYHGGDFASVKRVDIEKYKDKWSVFGDPWIAWRERTVSRSAIREWGYQFFPMLRYARASRPWCLRI